MMSEHGCVANASRHVAAPGANQESNETKPIGLYQRRQIIHLINRICGTSSRRVMEACGHAPELISGLFFPILFLLLVSVPFLWYAVCQLRSGLMSGKDVKYEGLVRRCPVFGVGSSTGVNIGLLGLFWYRTPGSFLRTLFLLCRFR